MSEIINQEPAKRRVPVNVLASDFENNYYMNSDPTMDGCPLQRAAMRAGLVEEGTMYHDYKYWPDAYNFKGDNYEGVAGFNPDQMVLSMYHKRIPLRDFTFEVEAD